MLVCLYAQTLILDISVEAILVCLYAKKSLLTLFFRASAASLAGGRMEVVWEYFGERFGSVLGVLLCGHGPDEHAGGGEPAGSQRRDARAARDREKRVNCSAQVANNII